MCDAHGAHGLACDAHKGSVLPGQKKTTTVMRFTANFQFIAAQFPRNARRGVPGDVTEAADDCNCLSAIPLRPT